MANSLGLPLPLVIPAKHHLSYKHGSPTEVSAIRHKPSEYLAKLLEAILGWKVSLNRVVPGQGHSFTERERYGWNNNSTTVGFCVLGVCLLLYTFKNIF
jgi:hypothetical protein